jgi:hypothetical protein
MYRSVVVAIALGLATPAAADTAEGASATSAVAPAPAPHRRIAHPHAVYVELFGRGGLWGLGYDYLLHPRVALGAAASFYPVDGERVTTFSPYAALYLLGGARHRWFAQGGPQIVRLSRPSPVPEWPGMSTTGYGASLASGYEYRGRLLVRAYALGIAGQGGIRPWVGFSVGVTR